MIPNTAPLCQKARRNQRNLMKVKEKSEKLTENSTFKKTKIMASSPITSWHIEGETMETAADYFLGLQINCRW